MILENNNIGGQKNITQKDLDSLLSKNFGTSLFNFKSMASTTQQIPGSAGNVGGATQPKEQK